MWVVVAFVVGVAVGVILEWSAWTRCRRQHMGVGIPSASANSRMAQLPPIDRAIAECGIRPGRSDRAAFEYTGANFMYQYLRRKLPPC
jgi:hypothetical protein